MSNVGRSGVLYANAREYVHVLYVAEAQGWLQNKQD